MLKTQKMTGSWLFAGVVGIVVYFAVILVMMLVESVLVSKGNISVDTAGLSILPIMMLASYLGCLMAGVFTNSNKIMGCVAVLAVSLVFRLLLTLFTYEGQIGGTIVYTLPELLGFALALLTVAKRGGKSRTKRIKKKYL